MASDFGMASSSTQSVITIVFGITATALSVVTVWQGRKFWNIWHDRRNVRSSEDTASRLELGIISNGPAHEANGITTTDPYPIPTSFQSFELPSNQTLSEATPAKPGDLDTSGPRIGGDLSSATPVSS